MQQSRTTGAGCRNVTSTQVALLINAGSQKTARLVGIILIFTYNPPIRVQQILQQTMYIICSGVLFVYTWYIIICCIIYCKSITSKSISLLYTVHLTYNIYTYRYLRYHRSISAQIRGSADNTQLIRHSVDICGYIQMIFRYTEIHLGWLNLG